MAIKIKKRDNVLIIYFAGRMLGGGNAKQVSEEINKRLLKGNAYFIFDLEKVRMINSIGIGMLMSSWTMITEASGKLVLCSLSEKVAEIFLPSRL